MEKLVEILTSLQLFNIAMCLGIVVMLLGIRQIGKESKELHKKNQRDNARLEKVYGDGTHIVLP